MLIDSSYFTKGSRHILNATSGTPTTPNSIEVNSAIEAYIAENQEQYLIQVLGHVLGNRVNSYLVCLEEDDVPKPNDHIDAVCKRLRESFADYVFFRMLRDMNTQGTITGLVRLESANDYAVPMRRQVNIWNSMVDKHRIFAAWCGSAECPLSGISIDSNMLTKINPLNL